MTTYISFCALLAGLNLVFFIVGLRKDWSTTTVMLSGIGTLGPAVVVLKALL